MRCLALFVASIGLMAISSARAPNQHPEPAVIPLPSNFEKSSTPAAALIQAVTVGSSEGAGDSHPLVRLDPAFLPEKGIAYVVFRAQENANVPCSRLLGPGCCTFTPADTYHVELAAELKTAALRSPATTKARWVRIVSSGDLAALGVPNLRGTPVIAAFGEDELAGARFAALYRHKRWASPEGSQSGSCNGHEHMQITWARLPGNGDVRPLRGRPGS